MIPTNLDECFRELDNMKIKDIDQWLSNNEDNAIATSHHALGQWIRNNWGLWCITKTPFWKESLQEYFLEMGIHHADDMSSIILCSYHRTKNGKDIDLKGQVKMYQKFWKKQKNNKKHQI